MHADAAGAEDGDGGVGALEHEAGAVFDGAAVLVGAVVGAVLEELVEEVAVGSVEFDAVESGGLGVLCAAAEGFDDAFDLFDFEGAGGDEGALRAEEADGACGCDGAGCDGELAVEEFGVGDAAYVPDLRVDVAAGIVDGGGDGLPGFDLLLRPEAGDVGVADAEGIDGGAFGDDEAGGGALGVVVDHDGSGDVVGGAAQAGEGGHEDAVGEVEIAELDGVEEVRCVCHVDWMHA